MRFAPLGDSAVTVVLGEGISRELSNDVMRFASALSSASINGLIEVVPSYASLALYYNPLQVAYAELVAQIRAVSAMPLAVDSTGGPTFSRTVRIPVRYDGEDLAEVAERTGHTRDEVIALHAGRQYHAYVIGFVPGFAYLGELDASLVLPRRSAPRKRVPPGAVAIAEAQTGIYPFFTPGGWHLIGSTMQRMFDPTAAEPALLRIGDRVVFDPIV